MKRTLIVVAHLDDETFGMGGTLYKLCKESPKDVKVVALCEGRDEQNTNERTFAFAKIQDKLKFKLSVYSYKDMELEMVPLKEITQIIENEIEMFAPKRIFTLNENDIHQDHRIVSHATKIAARPTRTSVEEIYEFKTPGCEPYSSTFFDTVHNIQDVIQIKYWMCEQYNTEKQPELENKEYFKTVYRKFEI